MAREMRRQLADARAMEEEGLRMALHGAGRSSAYGGRMTGAGATPSMGLSQFRGGGRRRKARSPSPMDEDEFDEDMEGGNIFSFLSAAARAAAARAAAATRAARAAAENARRAALGRTTQVRGSTGTAPRPPPAAPPKPPAAPPKPPTSTTPAPLKHDKVIGGPTVKAPVGSTRQRLAQIASKTGTVASRLGTAANLAIPAYMLYDYLNQQNQDLGYFDDYAGTGMEDEFDDGGADAEPPAPEETFDTQVDVGTGDDGEAEVDPEAEKDEAAAAMGLTRAEYDMWLRTGNLPVRRGRRRIGAGELTIKHGGQVRPPPRAGIPHIPRRPTLPPHMRPDYVPPNRRLPIIRQPVVDRRPPVSRLPVSRVGSQPLTQFLRREAPVPTLTASGRKSRATGRRAERAEVVRRVMRERGVKLGEASRIVKEEGLF